MVSLTDCLPYKSSSAPGSFDGGASSSGEAVANPEPGLLVFLASARFKAIASLILRAAGDGTGGGDSALGRDGVAGFVVDFVRVLTGIGVGVVVRGLTGVAALLVRVLTGVEVGGASVAPDFDGVEGDFVDVRDVAREVGIGTRDMVVV